jgi:hypothetical protein
MNIIQFIPMKIKNPSAEHSTAEFVVPLIVSLEGPKGILTL